jgi:uncharacterized protein YkwD
MPACDEPGCERVDGLSHSCNYCSGTFCSDHRLPEHHRCPGLRSDADSAGDLWGRTAEQSEGGTRREGRGLDSADTAGVNGQPDGGGQQFNSLPHAAWCALRNTVLIGLYALYLPLRMLKPVFGWAASKPLVSVLVAVVAVFVVATTAGTGVPVIDDTATGLANQGAVVLNGSLAADGEQLNSVRVEALVHQEINEIRGDRSLSRLDTDADLQQIARSHSTDMAASGYYAHTSPMGETFEDRYQRFGYACRVPTGGNEYLTGGENINKVYALTDYQTPDGVEYLGTEAAVAEVIVEEWMLSAGHRENILRPEWTAQGIGVNISSAAEHDGVVVHATQNFC